MEYKMVKIRFTGDLLCSPRMTELAGGNYDEIFVRAGALKECDYLVGNIETPVAGEELRYTYERYRFNTPTEFVRSMKKSGFNLLTLANNHCMDRGEQGILNTLENCAAEGMETIGIYAAREDRDRVFVKEMKGIRVAFVNYTYGTNAFAHGIFLEHPYMVNLFQPEETLKGSIHLLESNEEIGSNVKRIYKERSEEYEDVLPFLAQLEADIKRAKEEADFVVMIMHSGGQYNLEVDPYTEYLAARIQEFGADIIVGHHPHILQKCENKGGYLTIYSLGNLLNDPVKKVGDAVFMDHDYSAVFDLTLEKDPKGGIRVGKKFSIYTMVMNQQGLPQIINACQAAMEARESCMIQETLRWANLFAGESRYNKIQEEYEL